LPIKFQYNKTYLHQLGKELKIRVNALPTLVAKESALRLEVKTARAELQAVEQELKKKLEALSVMERLWPEFDFNLTQVADIIQGVRKIAGVKTPILERVRFEEKTFSLFGRPAWTAYGIDMLKSVLTLRIKKALATQKLEILEYARKKTTQKVNLYEKVQIPDYQDAIRRIKRFLEDEDNLAKSSQKILKARLQAAEAA